MQQEELRREAEKINWFHSMDLGPGVKSKGEYDPARRLKNLKLPERLDGKSVLDVGAWDGFYSFEVERRGAARVLATDWFSWDGPGWGTKRGFDLAHRALQSSVESMSIDVFDLSPERVGTFDIVLFLGVLYHLRNPLLALERVADVTKELLIVETEADMLGVRRPAAAFYPGTELHKDPTNWWGPNPAALKGMLQSVGFKEVQLVTRHSLGFRVARATFRKVRRTDSATIPVLLQRDRIVAHARR